MIKNLMINHSLQVAYIELDMECGYMSVPLIQLYIDVATW